MNASHICIFQQLENNMRYIILLFLFILSCSGNVPPPVKHIRQVTNDHFKYQNIETKILDRYVTLGGNGQKADIQISGSIKNHSGILINTMPFKITLKLSNNDTRVVYMACTLLVDEKKEFKRRFTIKLDRDNKVKEIVSIEFVHRIER